MDRTAHNNYLNYTSLDEFPKSELLADRILVRPEKYNDTIEVVDSPNCRPQKGEVLQVGQGKLTKKGVLIPLDVEPGDKIVFGPQAVTEVFLRDDYLLLMRESNVFGVVE